MEAMSMPTRALQPEGGRSGPADQRVWPVGLEAQAAQRLVGGGEPCTEIRRLPMKFGRVLAEDDALAQPVGAGNSAMAATAGIGLVALDHLEQLRCSGAD